MYFASFFEYPGTNIRSNAVRAVHQPMECMANADPQKTLAKLALFCVIIICVEIGTDILYYTVEKPREN